VKLHDPHRPFVALGLEERRGWARTLEVRCKPCDTKIAEVFVDPEKGPILSVRQRDQFNIDMQRAMRDGAIDSDPDFDVIDHDAVFFPTDYRLPHAPEVVQADCPAHIGIRLDVASLRSDHYEATNARRTIARRITPL